VQAPSRVRIPPSPLRSNTGGVRAACTPKPWTCAARRNPGFSWVRVAKQSPLEVRFYVALLAERGEPGYRDGPVRMRLWRHHKPAAMTDESILVPLGVPEHLHKGTRLLYSKRRARVLVDDRTYRKQRIQNCDVLVLTNAEDPSLIATLADAIGEEPGETRWKAAFRSLLHQIKFVGPPLERLLGSAPPCGGSPETRPPPERSTPV
jgi:hypothetical protein